ncbi:Protein CBG15130 [Caenorhabditis briggsae]|uniref:Protein CBG15130 n=1 Tax=Caenorhabditis briggsae TaxID=6238 RepID=A8XLE9_CAEBR|nr:Protein CBG15130 [Caenorhabditis briggsae]CAP33614.1 Protein CBG15130 [Caenorhabditis briggsae]
MNISSTIFFYFAILVAGIFGVEYGEIEYHRIEKRQFNFGQWGRNMGQRGENYGRDWGRQW